MKERGLDRKTFLKASFATLALIDYSRPAVARAEVNAQEPHWANKFIWVSEGGVPEAALTPDGKFGEFVAIIEPGKTGVGVFSQFIYDAADPITGQQMVIPGRENHPIVVAVSSHPNQTVERHFGNMPVRGGWFAVIENPGGVAKLSDAQLAEVVTVRKLALADPAKDNCIPGVGCQGPIEHVIIGWAGDVTEHSLPLGVDLTTRAPQLQPPVFQPVFEPGVKVPLQSNVLEVNKLERVTFKPGDIFVGDTELNIDQLSNTGHVTVFTTQRTLVALFGGNWYQNVPTERRAEILDAIVNTMKIAGCDGGCKEVIIKDDKGNLISRR